MQCLPMRRHGARVSCCPPKRSLWELGLPERALLPVGCSACQDSEPTPIVLVDGTSVVERRLSGCKVAMLASEVDLHSELDDALGRDAEVHRRAPRVAREEREDR